MDKLTLMDSHPVNDPVTMDDVPLISENFLNKCFLIAQELITSFAKHGIET